MEKNPAEESPIPIKKATPVASKPTLKENMEPLSPERVALVEDKFGKLFDIL
jgi:hypothetical protein